ncbi:hypothetical protein ACWEPC_36490 [Nonomuraea sp. NPDC004297]
MSYTERHGGGSVPERAAGVGGTGPGLVPPVKRLRWTGLRRRGAAVHDNRGGTVEAADDFRWVLDVHAPHMKSWRQRIEIDHDGWWWLVDGTRRRGRGRSTWRPADEVDAYAVVALLHTLNDRKWELRPEIREWVTQNRLTDEAIRRALNLRAYGLFIRYLLM